MLRGQKINAQRSKNQPQRSKNQSPGVETEGFGCARCVDKSLLQEHHLTKAQLEQDNEFGLLMETGRKIVAWWPEISIKLCTHIVALITGAQQ